MEGREITPFGKLLREHRLGAGLSQQALAERAGLSVRGISDLERGARVFPRFETVHLLADALGLDADLRASLLAAARPQSHSNPSTLRSTERSLPHPPAPMIGREQEVTEIVDLLLRPDMRLVTLTGPGGVGKTRLALEVASRLLDEFGDGVWFVDLSALGDPGLVAPTIAHTLGIRNFANDGAADDLISFLTPRRALLVLDNFEQVVSAGGVVAGLIATCPDVRVLVTSRIPLRLRGEREWMLRPLTLPSLASQDAEEWARADAVRLFVERATSVQQDIVLTGAEARAVAAICLRLDGLPLALELAAAQVKLLPPSALLAKLEQQLLPLLAHGASDLPARQRTMRSTIAWSYQLLDPPDQALFRRLSVFAGGWTLDAAEAVVNPDKKLDVLTGMKELVDGSLVRRDYAATPEVRFELLETVREFGLEQLTQRGEHLKIRDAHVAWLLDLVEQAGPELVGPHRVSWMSRLEQEVGNLRAALSWTWARGDFDTVIRLAAPIWNFWFGHGYADEAQDWLIRALNAGDTLPSPVRAEGFYAAGSLAATQVDHKRARRWLEEALSIWRALDDQAGSGRALHILGTHALEGNDNERAAAFLQRALSAYAAAPAMQGSPWVALAVSALAGAISRLGNHERAVALAERGLRLQRESGSLLGEALALTFLGDIELDQHNYVDAYRWYTEGVTMMRQLGSDWFSVHVLTGFTVVLTEVGLPEAAAIVLGAQEAALLATRHKVSARHQDAHVTALTKLRAILGENAFTESRAAGAALGIDAAVAYALEQEAD